MITSNLTEGEREVYGAMRMDTAEKLAWIKHRLAYNGTYRHRSWVCYILKRLVESGHVEKIRRGVYVRTA